MAERITRKMLDHAAELLNKIAGTPPQPFIQVLGNSQLAPYCFYVESGNGGYKLVQNSGTIAGGRDITRGYRKPAELYDLIHAYIDGMEKAQSIAAGRP